MKKTLLLLTLSLFAIAAAAQDLPRLRAIREKQLNETIFPTQRKEKWGYANEKGKFLIKAVFEQADFFRDVHIDPVDTVTLARVKFGGKWGLLNRDGTFLLDPCFDELKGFAQDVAVFRNNGTYGFLSYTGEIIREGLQELEDFLPGGVAWYKENGRWGVLRRDGTDVFPSLYTSKPTKDLSPGLLQTEVDGRFGIISLAKEKTVLAPECDGIDLDPKDPSLIIFQRGGRLGCLLADGTLVSPPQYDSIASIATKDGAREILIKKNGRFGKLAATGKELIPPVLATDQISDGREICQFFREGEPWVYYRNKAYSSRQFDNLVHESVSRDNYLSLTDNLPFPAWMRQHVFEELDEEEGELRWREDSPFYLFSEDGKYRQRKYLNGENAAVITLGKDMRIIESNGFRVPFDAALASVSIESDGTIFPCGSWLTTLFRSIDAKKVTAYDQNHGTNIMESWSSVSFRVPVKTVVNGKLILIVDIFVGRYFAQRILASLSSKGSPLFTIKESGELYSDDPVDEDSAILAVIGDHILFVSTKGESVSSTLYTQAGKKFISMDGFLPLYNFVSDSDYLFIGVTAEDDAQMLRYGRNGTLLRKDENLQFVSGISGDDIHPEWVSVADGRFLISDWSTGLLRELVNMDTPTLRTPVLRYTLSQWDGQPIVAVSKNHWSDISEARWEYIPGPAQRDGAFSRQLGDVDLLVSAETGENGIGVYSVKYADDSDEARRYGFIGFETPFFTAPVFEDARVFSGGAASVKVHGEWLPMSLEELQKFAGDPRGAIDPDAGHPIVGE